MTIRRDRYSELTIMLADTHMSDLTPFTPVIERGMALHKMIR